MPDEKQNRYLHHYFRALVEERDRYEWSLQDLAAQLDVSRSYITDRQRGRRDVRRLDVLALEHLLGGEAVQSANADLPEDV